MAVFPLDENGNQTSICCYFCNCLLKAKFEIFCYLSIQYDELYVLINCNDEVLKEFADNIDYELELDPNMVENLLEEGNPEKEIMPSCIPHRPDITPLAPYVYIYGKYDTDINQSLYKSQGDDGELFAHATKLKIIYSKIESDRRFGGCALPSKYGAAITFMFCHILLNSSKIDSTWRYAGVLPSA